MTNQASDKSVSGNGLRQARPTRPRGVWTGNLSPVTFARTQTEADLGIIETAPVGTTGEQFIRESANPELETRSMVKLPGGEAPSAAFGTQGGRCVTNAIVPISCRRVVRDGFEMLQILSADEKALSTRCDYSKLRTTGETDWLDDRWLPGAEAFCPRCGRLVGWPPDVLGLDFCKCA